MRWLTAIIIIAVSSPGYAISPPPDGIYDLVVGGEKRGVGVVEAGIFTRPVQAGKCTLEQAEGAVDGETLTVQIADKCLPQTVLDLRQNQGKLKFQESNSFYLNASVSATGGEKPVISLASGVFQGKHFAYSDAFLDTQNNRYNRGNTRIERDVPDLFSKLTVGDLNSETGSSLAFGKRLGGIKFERNWAQDPDRAATVYYSSSHTLKLTSRSTVEIFRDGQLVDRRELSSGEYDIRNLPAAAYASRLKIKVTDAYGAVKEIEADMINPPRLLARGTLDYSLAVGSERTGFEYFGAYENRMTGGGYVGYGVTHWLTLFGAVSGKVATGTVSVATQIGLISGETRLDNIGDWRAAYSYSLRNFGINAEHREQNGERFSNANMSVGLDKFGTLSGRLGVDDAKKTYGLSHNLSLPLSISTTVGVDFNNTGQIAYSTGVTKQWSPRLSTQATYSRAFDKSSTIYAQVTFSLDRAKAAAAGFQASATARDGETSVQTRTEGRAGIYASLATYTPARGRTTETVTAAGSLACADGACRVGEPVSGGFAIGDGLESAGFSGSLVPLPAYSNTLITASNRTSTESQVVAVRPGQGIKLTIEDKISVQGVVTVGGKPACMVSVTWEGGETITGEDGLLWLDRLSKKATNIVIAGKTVTLMLDREPQDGVVDVGIIGI